MIRKVKLEDAGEITTIYNEYIVNSVISFETEALQEEEMRSRIQEISEKFPYFVYEAEGKIVGYCYAHPWKSRAAYCNTLETTVYIVREYTGKGIGKELMTHLMEACKQGGYHALIACITGGNEASCKLHANLGFKQVSRFEQVGLKFGKWLDVVDYEYVYR